jgi:hypothetical protein
MTARSGGMANDLVGGRTIVGELGPPAHVFGDACAGPIS